MMDLPADTPAVAVFGQLRVDFTANKLNVTGKHTVIRANAWEMAVLHDLLNHRRQIRTVAAVQTAIERRLNKTYAQSGFKSRLSKLRRKLDSLTDRSGGCVGIISIRKKGVALVDLRDPASFPPEYLSKELEYPAEEQALPSCTKLQLALLACFINAGDRHLPLSELRRNVMANCLGDPSDADIKRHLEELKPLVKDVSRGRLLRGWADGCYSLTNLLATDPLGRAALPYARFPVPKLEKRSRATANHPAAGPGG